VTHFSDDVITAVLAHMNDDHRDDSLIIVRAFAEPDATDAIMTGLDSEAGQWSATVADRTIPVSVRWGTAITQRPGIRREVALLYREACSVLGIEPRIG
jgi:hypothetical protein